MKISLRHLVVGMVMMASAGAAAMLEPTRLAVQKGQERNLESLIPKQFGAWREAPMVEVSQISNTVPGAGDAIYDQTLMRNYIGPHGEFVMVAVAYGVRQNDQLKVHRPEVCYSAQGFQVMQSRSEDIHAGASSFPVTRLVTRNGARVEPVTYWIRMGDEVMRGGLHQRLAVIKAGLMGAIPDGLLFRVSTIVNSESQGDQAFRIEDEFLAGLLGSMGQGNRDFLIGTKPENGK